MSDEVLVSVEGVSKKYCRSLKRGECLGLIGPSGAGFNPILTGRENIYVNGTVLGFSKKEIDRKFDAIVDFAEIEELYRSRCAATSRSVT